jgi:putative transposase
MEEGVVGAIQDEPRSGQPIKYDEKIKADIIALACSKAPEGRSRWTLRLLENTLKIEHSLETINRETIRLILKKTNVSLG